MTQPKVIRFSQPMSQPPQNAQRPPMANRSSTTDTNSSTNTVASSRNTSITISPPLCRLPQFNQHGHPVDVLSRKYPRPLSPINVEEALNLPAQPGTFRYQLEKGEEIQAREISAESKKEEFERVKNVLKSWGK